MCVYVRVDGILLVREVLLIPREHHLRLFWDSQGLEVLWSLCCLTSSLHMEETSQTRCTTPMRLLGSRKASVLNRIHISLQFTRNSTWSRFENCSNSHEKLTKLKLKSVLNIHQNHSSTVQEVISSHHYMFIYLLFNNNMYIRLKTCVYNRRRNQWLTW